jgi:hypothetical protein
MVVKMNIQPDLYCMTNYFIILLFSIVMTDSIYEGRSSSKVSDFFSQDWEQIDTCGLV